MGKGRDKRRRKAKGEEVVRTYKSDPLGGGFFDPSDPPYAQVHAPLKPKPSLRSGAIALPEPDESEYSISEVVGVRFSK